MINQENSGQSLKFFQILQDIENILLCLLLGIMITVSCVQIFLRILFDSGLLWADPLVRYLVLWSGILGAVSATTSNKHISLDLFHKILPKGAQNYIGLVTHIFCIMVSGFLTWASVTFVLDEYLYPTPGLLSVPSWVWYIIFPIGFGMITLKYSILLITRAFHLLQSSSHQDDVN